MTVPPSTLPSRQPLKAPIGISDFAKLVEGGYTFVDKTALIADLIERGAEVTLITRPRRFGKTLNLSMLQHFYAAKVNDKPTGALFENLAIAQSKTAMAHQGQYPVIFFSFKDIKATSFKEFETRLRGMLANLYRQYPELLKSPQVDPDSRRDLRDMRARKAAPDQMVYAFRLLSELLYKHYGRKVVILLDEYDTPIQSAYTNGFYPQIIGFMRNLLGAALKDNPYLLKSVVTGILRVSKESLFSDLNNIKVHTVLDEGYSPYFGFTEAEVSGLLRTAGLTTNNPAIEGQIKAWYNGYRFGTQIIYNPWSIVSCLDEQGRLRPYWVRTSGSELLKQLMAQADAGFKEGLEQLIQGRSASELVDPNMVFGDLDGNSTALWSLLLFSGYLTALAVEPAGTRERCELAIPNQEIRHLYEDIVREWFTDTLQTQGYRNFLESLASGDVAGFEALLRDYLLRSASFFDANGRDPEKFYHGLALGLIAGLRDTHDIQSNRESGYGRYDLALLPKAGGKHTLGVILEFKQIRDSAGLKDAAAEALAQIDTMHYATDLQQRPLRKILAIGMAFSGKELALASTVHDNAQAR